MLLYLDTKEWDRVLQAVAGDNTCDFYSKKYANRSIDSAKIAQLPFLERYELVETPVHERLYIPRQDVRYIANTSGTTSGRPLLTPFGSIAEYGFEPSLGLGAVRPLIVYPPLNKVFGASFIQQCAQAKDRVTPIFGDVQQLANSAVLAREIACDSLYATPTLALQLADYIDEYYSVYAIRVLAVASELLTQSLQRQLQIKYPNAQIVNLYASSEIGQFIMHSQTHGNRTDLFTVLTHAVTAIELIGGELVVTYTKNPAFPLIRYKTGDYFTLVEKDPLTLALNGREGVDVVKVAGFEVRSQDIDSFFEHIPHSLQQYQVHFYNGDTPQSVCIQIECVAQGDMFEPEALALIRQLFITECKVTDSQTINDLLSKNIVESVECVSVPHVSVKGVKRRVLVQHM